MVLNTDMPKSMLTVAIALAAILSLSLFAHAFAAEENNNDRVTKVEDKKTGTVGTGVKEAPGPKPIKKDNNNKQQKVKSDDDDKKPVRFLMQAVALKL